MIKFLLNVCAFIGLLALMGIVSHIPYGQYANVAIVAIALWKLVNK